VSEFANLILRFIKLTIIICFVTHWNACIFYGVALNADNPNSWIKHNNLEDEPLTVKYVTALYWAFTTMMSIGYGDIYAGSTYERMATVWCIIISSGIFSFIIGDIGKMVRNFNVLAAHFRERMLYVE